MKTFVFWVLGPGVVMVGMMVIPQWLWLPVMIAAAPGIIYWFDADQTVSGIKELEYFANDAAWAAEMPEEEL